jgi:hypothetical protein
MNLYPPLFVPRQVIEPERFASLRPPVYEGTLLNQAANVGGQVFNQTSVNGGFQGNGQNLGGLGIGGGMQGGFQGNLQGAPLNPYQANNLNSQMLGVNRLTYEQLQKRRQEREKVREEAKKTGNSMDSPVLLDPFGGANPAALAETVGDPARYTLDHKLSLARQRSALLPLVNQQVSAQRVSIFNDKVHGKFPLRGLKIKNGTGQNLMQGPASVYEGDSYAGDARLPDLQANEERLLSYAVDQAVEIKSEMKQAAETLQLIRIVKGVVEETHRQRATMRYLITNRSGQDRTLIVEHPIHADWKLVGVEKPAERSRDYYRFEWKVQPGKGLVREVVQERTRRQNISVNALDENGIDVLARNSMISPKLREAFQTALGHKRKLNDTQRELVRLRAQFAEVTQEQMRVRSSLDKVPPNTSLHKRYLEKLDKLETDIETLQAKIKENQEQEKKQQTEFVSYIEGLTVE